MQINCIVDVNAGQNRENVSLQEGDKKFQTRHSDQPGNWYYTEQPQREHEAADHLQQGMACHHIGE